MSVQVLYRTAARAPGGRDGRAATLDGALDVSLATPKDLGGGECGGASGRPRALRDARDRRPLRASLRGRPRAGHLIGR